MRTPAQNAQLALLCEVSGTPKPGNVDRHRDLADLRFEHFLVGAVSAQEGLQIAENGGAVGTAFERAVAGMANQQGGNTQFGALLLLVPLVRAASDRLVQPVAETVVSETTVADAAEFYRAFEHVDVFVDDPPEDSEALDIRRGADAIAAIEEREITLLEIMERSVPGDDVAREWVRGFERSFEAGEQLSTLEGPVLDRAAKTFLSLLGDRPDTFVTKHVGEEIASNVSERAQALVERNAMETDRAAVEKFADDLVSRGINPGTTADITAAGLFIAFENGGLQI